ncbi:TRAP transporter small permease subunit [Marivita hallyeonensis]|uniref:TRAP transporter small permease protein n=1 Tax=Marivita hallyeonensis TaxID=996342 RepID=A0A1M5U2S6_9RHOB|nr:TRAP transporter small permease subunit [Marivita hallyeonensis]SHH57248.1 TRAP-type mannitol/chloroaromatic compound transport system, small permease component [Marivita hallyeonensis]
MTGLLQRYVALVDPFNRMIGRIVMYGIFVMMGILLWSSISKAFFVPSLWTLEMAQYAMVAYYILGGPYAIQMGSNVRMDLIYGEISDRRKAAIDAITVLFLLTYLGFLFYGGVASTAYSLGYFGSEPFSFFTGLLTGAEELGFLERSPTAWRPYLWPIKTIMVIGILLMLLQVLCELAKDILRLKGHDMGAKV